jgi:DNA repair protein RadD
LDFRTSGKERFRIIQRFRRGEIQVLSSVNVLAVGFDVPDASCAILARPTLSEALDMQQKGRILRPAEGKTDALILDHAGNTLRFGMPDNFVPPDLNSKDRPNTKQKRKQQVMVACNECGYALEPKQSTCPNCGTDRRPKQSKVVYIDGDLVEYGTKNVGKRVYSDEEMLDWYLAFKWYVERQGKDVNRAFAYFIGKFGEENKKRCQWSWRYLPSRMPSEEQFRFIKHLHTRWAHAQTRRKRKDPKPCPNCGGVEVIRTKGAGPHAAGKRCASCNRHLGWMKRGEVDQVDRK